MDNKLEFKVGWGMAFVPMATFLFFCVLYFMVFKVFEMHALAMGAFIGLLFGALFSKSYKDFWLWVIRGIGDPVSVEIVVILFIIGMFAQLIKVCNVSLSFVWLASNIGVYGSLFTLFVFLATCVIATATGSSIGTMFTCFPIFFPAGVVLGSNPAVLAGAIVSGAIFGDNLAPISDSTIISVSTQNYATKKGIADIGGAVATRFKYAILAAVGASILYLLTGGGWTTGTGVSEVLGTSGEAIGLVMLIPVSVLLIVAMMTRNIYKAITVGLVLGTITGLLAKLITPTDVLNFDGGAAGGFLADGIGGMMGTVALVISVFGIMGVLKGAGALEMMVKMITQSKLGRTARGAEVAMMLGISALNLLFSGVTSATMITFGPVVDEVGRRNKLHPYRRANLLDGLANSITVCVPFLSAFVFIGAQLVKGYDFIEPISPVNIAAGMYHPMMLFLVFMISIITGWGRIYEGPNGEPVKKKDDAYTIKHVVTTD